MSPRHLATGMTLTMVGALLTASPAAARAPGEQRVHHPEVTMVRTGDHLPASITTTVTPGGTSLITTPTLDKDIKTLTVEVEPKDVNAEQEQAFLAFNNSLASLSKGKRLMVCTMMYQAVAAPFSPVGDEASVDGLHLTIAGAVLLACLELAGLLESSQRPQPRSAAASQKCGQLVPSLPATVTKASGGYSVTASGTVAKAKKPPLKVKCRTTGSTIKYTVRARKKGKTLRQVVGKNLMIGLKSPVDASTSVPVTVTFSKG